MKIHPRSYNLHIPTSLSKEVLAGYVNQYWKDEYQPLYDKATSIIQLDKDKNPIENRIHLLLLVKVIFEDSSEGYKTLGDMRKVNIGDKDLFINYLSQRLGVLSDSYRVTPVSEITFSAIKMKGVAPDTDSTLKHNEYQVTTHLFNNMILPLTMDPLKFGELLQNQKKQVIILVT